MECEHKINISWVKVLPSQLCGNAIYFVKSGTGIKMYVTNYQGVASLIGETGSGGGNTVITSPDETITVGQSGQTFTLSVSQTLQTLINGALQEGDNITLLNNDAGYITLADIVTSAPFHPVNIPYDGSQTFTLPPNVVALDVRPNGTSSDVSFTQVGDQVTYTGTPAVSEGGFWTVVGIYTDIPMGSIPNLNMVTNAGSSSDVTIQTPNAVNPQDLTPLNQVEQLIADAGTGGIQTIVAGTNITVDATDPLNPIVSSTGGGGGAVDSVNGQTGVVVLDADDIDDTSTTNKFTTATEITKLAGIEDGAEVNNISDANATDLTDGNDSTLHFHATDRNRANHTGTQTASTISDFDTAVSANSAVTANTAKVTNATHTGEVTGATTLTIHPTAISNKTAKTNLLGTEELLINDAGTLKKVVASHLFFDINDSTLSAGVSSTTNVLIKTYDIGFLSGFKTLYCETLGFKSVVATGDFRFTIFLREKTTPFTSYQLATSSGTTTSQHVVSVFRFTIDQPSGVIRLLNPALNTPTYLGNVVSNITEYSIDFAKEYEIQVFLRVGDVAVEAKQYFNQIRKR